jgi:hypothetical protein
MFSMTCGVAPTRSIPVSPALSRRARSPSESASVNAAAAPQQVFTLRRQPDAATEAVEQRHAQFGFQRANLSGKRGLAQIHSIGSAGKAAGIGNADEGAQVAKIHAAHDNNFASIGER